MTKSIFEKELMKRGVCSLEVHEALQKAKEELNHNLINDFRIEHKSCGYAIKHFEEVFGK